ncbi:hypothetical protein HDU84_001518, partial [Entophlyctis sp. JEL0112]
MALLAVSAQLLEEAPIINATDNAGNANETSDCGMLVGNAASDCDCVGGSGPVFAIAPSPTRTASVPSLDVDDVGENYVDADGGVATEALNLCPTPLKQQCIAVMDRNAPAQLHAGFVLQPLLLDMMLVESDSAAAVGPDALMHADELMAHTTSDAMLESFSALRLHDRPSVSVVTSLLSSASTVNVAGAASHGHQEVVIHDGAGAVAGEHADETLFEDLEAATAATPGLPSLHAAPPLPDDDDDGDDAALAQNASPLSRLLRSVRLPFNATQSRSLLSRRRRAHAVRAGPGDEPLTVVVNQQLPHLEDDAPPPPPPPPPPPVSPQSPTATLVSAATADAPLSPRPRYAAAPTPGDKGKKFLTLLTDLPPAVYQQHQLEFAEIYSAPRRTRDAAAGVAALYMCPICWEARVLRDLVVVGDCGRKSAVAWRPSVRSPLL